MSTDLKSLWNAIQRGDAHDIAFHMFPEPQQPMPGCPALVEGSSPTAGPGTAGAGIFYPVTCRPRYYDAASQILENEGPLSTHDNCNELGALIEQWIHDARDNWEPRT